MIMKKIIVLVMILEFISISPALSIDFFQARPAGMAGAGIAVGQSADAVRINSAATHNISRPQIAANYIALYPGLATDKLSVSQISAIYPLKGTSNISFAYEEFNSDRITNSLFQIGISGDVGKIISFIKHDVLMSIDGVVYYRHYKENIFTRNDPIFSGGRNATAFSMNINFFGDVTKNLQWGLAFRNIIKPDLGLKQDDYLPREGGLGLAYRLPFILGALDILTDGRNTSVRTGLEKSFFKDMFVFRGGYAFGDNRLSNISLGTGIKYNKHRIMTILNYAYTFSLTGATDGTSGIHQVGGVVSF